MITDIQFNLDQPNLDLELSEQDMRAYTQAAMEKIVDYFSTVNVEQTTNFEGLDKFTHMSKEALPQQGTPFNQLLSFIFDDALPVGINLPSPGYLAYIPVATLFHTALSELISKSINRWPGIYKFAPAFVEMEKASLRWLGDIMGLPKTSGGILTSGGSLANFSATFVARMHKLGDDITGGVMYTSDQAHHSVIRSARLCGFPLESVRIIKTDKNCRIDVEQLEERIGQDQREGLKPFLLVGIAGTTNTGAVDDLNALADIADQHSLWFHVDAAWAGAFRLTDYGKKLMSGTERADSITFDPHKALYTSFGCGALLMREPEHLKAAHSIEANYLPDDSANSEHVDFAYMTPELSRTFRGMHIWLPFKMHGIQPFKDNMEEKLALTVWAEEQLKTIPGIEIYCETQLSLVAFRYVKSGLDQAKLNEINQFILDEVNKDGRLLITATTIRGDLIQRIVPFGMRTHKPTVKLAIDLIKRAVEELG